MLFILKNRYLRVNLKSHMISLMEILMSFSIK